MTRQRTDRVQLVGLMLAGYLLVWTLFGIMAVLGDGVLHTAVERSAWLAEHAWLIGAGIFVVAGLYQFTPLKYYCLDKCRSPYHVRWHVLCGAWGLASYSPDFTKRADRQHA